jgi:hypothetical protein
MAWRLMFGAVLTTLALGCDRHNGTQFSPTVFTPGGLSVLIVSGTSVVTTTVFPTNPLRVPRGSTLTCLDSNNAPQPATIAGTVNSGVGASGTRGSVTLPNAGTFTLGCALQPGIIVTVLVL